VITVADRYRHASYQALVTGFLYFLTSTTFNNCELSTRGF